MQPVEFEFIYMFNLSSKTGILFQDIRQTQTPCAIKRFALNSRKLFLRLFALIYYVLFTQQPIPLPYTFYHS